MTPAFSHGFRVVGDRRAIRRPIDWTRAFLACAVCDPAADLDAESYLSHFTFGPDLIDHMKRERSERGYVGPCGVSWLFWDIDRADDLEAAQRDARRLLGVLLDRHHELDDDDPLVFFSGSKGFHIGVPATWRPGPSADFHIVARRFCLDLAETAGVVVDPTVYSKTRLFRAPNSRHAKTGLHKLRVSLDEIMHLKCEVIVEKARRPDSFDVPTGPADFPSAAKAWDQARLAVNAGAARRTTGRQGNGGRLSAGLRRFIRDGEIDPEKRAVATFRAAAELSEFHAANGFDDLAHALLEEAALDSGLAPAEVRKQIRDGLAHGSRTTQREGAAGD